MATMNNLAHPYAKAAFETANSTNTLELWLEGLRCLSLVVQDVDFIELINNPKVSNEQILGVLFSVLKSDGNTGDNIDNNDSNSGSDNSIKKFLLLLCDNHRLQILPEIYTLFEELCNVAKNKVDAVIQSAFAMNIEDKTRLEGILSKKFGKTVTATVEVCPELIGGIKIIINDTVIDSSIRGSLNKMATGLIQ